MYNPTSKEIKVVISEEAYLTLLKNSKKFKLSTGNLAGFKKNNLIYVSKSKHFLGTDNINQDLSFKDENYIKLMNWEEELFSKTPPLYVVGWYKIWYGEFIPRGYDITTQMGKQGLNPEAFMIILNPYEIKKADPGLRIIRFKDFKSETNFKVEYLEFKIQMIQERGHRSFLDMLNDQTIQIKA